MSRTSPIKTSSLAGLILLISGVLASSALAQVPVRATPVEARSLQKRHAVTGTLQAVSRGNVAALESGRLLEMTVREGAIVKKGDLLARVDARRLQAELRQAQADKLVAEADLLSHQATVEQTSASHERAQRLLEKDAVSDQEFEQAVAEVRVARARVAATGRRIEAIEQRVRHLEIRISDTEVLAPYDATVIQRHVEPGDWVQPGDPLLTVVSTGPIEAWLEVPERFVESVSRYGNAVTVRSRATGDAAQVLSTRRIADVNRRVRTMSFVVTLANHDGLLTPGMSVDGWIAVTGEVQATAVAKDAVIQGTGTPYVYRVRGSAKQRVAERVPVRIQFETERFVAIDSVSLRPGDLVIVEGNERLTPGQTIAVTVEAEPNSTHLARR